MKTITIARIVATTDFSAAAERAVRRGALIAKQLGAEFHLLHVVYPLDLYPGLMLAFDSRQTELERLRQETGKTRVDTMADALQQEYGIRIKTATRIGRAHTQIAEYAVAHAAGLLVVGARGENTMLDLLLGSTASRLLRVATCPVLIVRNAEAVAYRQAIAAVDFPEGSAAVPTFARTVAPDARIEVLHIFDLVQEARMREIGLDDAQLQKYRDDALAKMQTQLDEMLAVLEDDRMTRQALTGYPPEEICARAVTLGADLIVLGRQGKSDLQEFLLGTVSKDVASAADCDVLLTT